MDWRSMLGSGFSWFHLWSFSSNSVQFYRNGFVFTLYDSCLMKKALIIMAALAAIACFLYYGVLFSLVSIVLFLSDVIIEIGNLIW